MASARVSRLFRFSEEFIAGLPPTPGVYQISDEKGVLIYLGKAKNLRRRLAQYRNAKRCKKHRKMIKIQKEAASVEILHCASDLEACLLEAKLIQQHRPRWNVAGAFYFLYPLIGVKQVEGVIYFNYTTQPEQHPEYRFHGAYRSREITGEAFFALMKLLRFVGHAVPKNRKEYQKNSYVFSYRQLSMAWVEKLEDYLRGESKDAMEELVMSLVENAGARKSPEKIQEYLDALKRFWKHEALLLRKACKKVGEKNYPVPQTERDLVFLRYRYGVNSAPTAAKEEARPQEVPVG